MLLILGASGYVGQAFVRELRRRDAPFIPLARTDLDYGSFELLLDYVRRVNPRWVLNAAGYWGTTAGGAWEVNRDLAFKANALLPQTVSRVCMLMKIPCAHVSSSSIYSGAKVLERGCTRGERSLDTPAITELFERQPERFFGFTELDPPNSSFRNFPCSVLSGTRALGEENLRGAEQTYIWRISMPLDHTPSPHNWLAQFQAGRRLRNHVTSLSHLTEFAGACLDLAERRAPFGTYNVANPGAVSARQAASIIQRATESDDSSVFTASHLPSGVIDEQASRSSCILDVTKLLRAGVQMRSAQQALADCIQHAVSVRAASSVCFDPALNRVS